ncbi:MAG: adenine phosphoribosyltransferase [Dehalococcoidia bacterium]|nr:adenine phosphoribosyltransferase [Dehalococcoidia bacterium]
MPPEPPALPASHRPTVAQIESWRALIRDVPDFPRSGVLFRDITPLLYDPRALREVNDALAAAARAMQPTLIAGIEARGFIFAVAVAERLGLPFVPVRKPGKLPGKAASAAYALEYGASSLELHLDPSVRGQRAVVIDDVVATGGSAEATARLLRELGATVAGFAFLAELAALDGRAQLAEYAVEALLRI